MASLMGEQLLAGDLVRLTRLTSSDSTGMSAWYEDIEFLRLFDAAVAVPRSREELELKVQTAQKSPNTYLFGIRPRDDEILLGTVEIEGILWTHGCGWVAIALAKPFWHHGYGADAMRILLRFAFCELNLHRLQLTVFEYNHRARGLYEKLGFRHEGTFREFLSRDGRRYDMLLMGLLASEWRDAVWSDDASGPAA